MSKRSKVVDFDLIVIGSGAAGGVAAHIAAREGKKVALVEDDKIGGECPNYGCIPTKALIHAADTYKTVQEADQYGIKVGSVKTDFAKLQEWKDLTVKRTGVSVGDEVYKKEGVEVIRGHGHFIDSNTISVDRKRYTARKFLIATGTHSYIPPIEGLAENGFITHRQAIDFKKAPKTLFIIGGGPIGSEFAYIYSSLDIKVVLAEYSDRLVAREDREVGEVLKSILSDNGVKVLTSTKVLKVEKKRGKKVIHFENNGKKGYAAVDEVMLAAGMHPNVDLGLENAGVKYSPRGIDVDHGMQTSNKNIYAAGDVTGGYAYTHIATYQSRIAMHNMFKRTPLVAKYHAVPRVIFTFPEIASVGLSEKQLKLEGIRFTSNTVPINIVGRSNVSNHSEGFVKVIASKQGVLLGATIASPRAGEMIHELGLAVNLGLTADDVASTIHAFPTWSEAVRAACAGL